MRSFSNRLPLLNPVNFDKTPPACILPVVSNERRKGIGRSLSSYCEDVIECDIRACFNYLTRVVHLFILNVYSLELTGEKKENLFACHKPHFHYKRRNDNRVFLSEVSEHIGVSTNF